MSQVTLNLSPTVVDYLKELVTLAREANTERQTELESATHEPDRILQLKECGEIHKITTEFLDSLPHKETTMDQETIDLGMNYCVGSLEAFLKSRGLNDDPNTVHELFQLIMDRAKEQLATGHQLY